jgi:methylsterol monooxygenase
VLVNQWAIAFPLLVASYYFQKMINRMPEIQELPTVERTLFDFLVLFICEEVGVYYVHRYLVEANVEAYF